MHSRFERQLEELDLGLKGLPAAECREMREEAAQHLAELAAAHQELGATEEEAASAAVASFGEARIVAQGIRRESIRKRTRQRAERTAAIGAAMLAGAVLAIGLAALPFAPIVVRGNEITAVYPILGALAGFACLAQKRILMSLALGTLLTLTFVIQFSILLQQALAAPFYFAMHNMSAGATGPLVLLCWIATAGFRYIALASPEALLAGLIVGIPFWMRRHTRPISVLLASVLCYGAVSTVFEVAMLQGRTYLTPSAIAQDLICSLLLWMGQGFLFGLMLLLARRLAYTLLEKGRVILRSVSSSSLPADRPHRA